MNLLEHINYRSTFEQVFEQELLKFICFFQDNLSNDSSDEIDLNTITPDDFEAIEALADKIKHMTLYIGCPNSVKPMLESIANRNLKYWQGEPFFMNSMEDKGFIKGKQIKRKSDFKAVVLQSMEEYNKKGIIKGHFRWNNRGYILSRKCTDLLTSYLNKTA